MTASLPDSEDGSSRRQGIAATHLTYQLAIGVFCLPDIKGDRS